MAGLAVLLAALNGTATLINGTLVNTTALNATTAHHNSTAHTSTLQPLAFVSPHVDVTQTLRYNVGETVNVSWTSPFEHTTVEIMQGPSKDGGYAMHVIAANCTQNQTSAIWEAGPLKDSNSAGNFHFRLQKGHRPNDCDGCRRDGPTFELVHLGSASPTIVSTPSATSATDVAAESTALPMPALSRSVKLGIGLGIGLGVAVGLALFGIMVLSLNRRQTREQAGRDLAAAQEKQKDLRYSSGSESSAATIRRPPASYHPSFEFEGQDGATREGFSAFWHRIFGRS